MNSLLNEEIRRKARLAAQWQEFKTCVTPAKGEMSGRSVKQIDAESKESRHYQSYALSSVEDRIRDNFVNTVKKSLQSHFLDYAQFHKQWMGKIVVLIGTSTAGKTSIINALRKLKPDFREDGIDLRCMQILLKTIQKTNPDEYGILKKTMKGPLDIPKAAYGKERNWKEGVTAQEKEKAEEAIGRVSKPNYCSLFQNLEQEMFEDLFTHSRRGGNVIFDLLNIDSLFRHIMARRFDGPIQAVLTYCPFHVLSSRMEKRNKEAIESGEFSNLREGEFPFMQFSELYGPKKEGETSLERLTRSQVTKTFDENFDRGVEAARLAGDPLPPPEKILEDKEALRGEFLKNLGFKNGVEEVEIAPKNRWFYQQVIDSSKLTPGESAAMLPN